MPWRFPALPCQSLAQRFTALPPLCVTMICRRGSMPCRRGAGRSCSLPSLCADVLSRCDASVTLALAVQCSAMRCSADAEPPDALPQPSHAMLILCGVLRLHESRAMPPQRISSRTFAVAVPCFAEQSHCDSEQRPCGAYPVHAVAVRVASVLCRRGANLGSGRASLSRCSCDRSRALPCRGRAEPCRAIAMPLLRPASQCPRCAFLRQALPQLCAA